MDVDTQVAEQFGHAVAKGDFATAHALLTEEAQRIHSAEVMKQAVADMTAYADGPIQHVVVDSGFVVDDWPDKQDGDVAWVYVALTGDSFVEAASVLLATTGDGVRIRQVEWGRP